MGSTGRVAMDTDIRYLIEQGKNFFKNQAYKKAESIFEKIIADKKEFADVYNMLGVINHQGGEFNRAITYFQKALKINTNYTEAMLNLSVLYNDLGEYKQARALVAKSKKESKKTRDQLDPFLKGKLANKHAEVGDLYRGVGIYDRAVQEYKRALELAPNFYDIRNRLGICLRELGKKKDALKEFQKIAKEKPSYMEAQVQLGVTYYSLAQKKEARNVWNKLAAKNPKHELVRMYLKLSDGEKSAPPRSPKSRKMH